ETTNASVTMPSLPPMQYIAPIVCNGLPLYDLSQLDNGYGALELAACAIDGHRCTTIDFSFATSLVNVADCYCNSEIIRCLARHNCSLSVCAQSYCHANCPSIGCNSAYHTKLVSNVLICLLLVVFLLDY